MIGQQILHYKIIEKLGEGGMGMVYLAEDTKLGRMAALKFLPSELNSDPDARHRFVREARAASALDHTNIGTIYEINDEDPRPFIAMAYYEGESLRDKMAKGRVDIPEAINLIIEIARGLEHAHNHNIVHRDIKPANILCTKEGEIKIIDFGLAKLTGQTVLTQTGQTLGTVAYMSPEQTYGTDIDYRTDIWALGVIMYEMLAGQRPFSGSYDQAVMYSIMNEEPEYLGRVNDQVPPALEKIVHRALAKEPGKRFQNMGELISALGEAREGSRTKTVQTSLIRRLSRKQRNILIRFTPVVIIMVLVAVYFLFIREVQASPISIALLPLTSIIDQQGQEDWFTDGMTDALITNLARISGLRVISRSSVMRYKQSGKTASEIANELGVRYVIEGSVMKIENQVKISTRLIDAPNDEYLWAHDYERDLVNILSLQGEVAREIANQIEVKLTPQEQSRLSTQQQVNPPAYEAFLKGNFFWFKLSREGLDTALRYYELAAELDSTYAPAYAGIALVWGGRAQMGYEPFEEVRKHAQPAAAKALELDSTLAEVHYMKAIIFAWGEWNWDLAVKEYEKVLELNPGMAEARAYYSHVLFIINRPEEAMLQIEKALALDPFNPLFKAIYAMDLMYARRFNDVIKSMEDLLQKSPEEYIALSTLRSAYHMTRQYDDAIRIWQESFRVRGDNEAIEILNAGYAEGGYSRALQRVAELMIERTKQGKYVTPWQIATLYTRAGMSEEALNWFDKALAAHDPNMPYLNVDPIFDELRELPRFRALLGKIGFKDRIDKLN